MAYFQSFLTVASSGLILGYNTARKDIADRETWRCEDFGDHVRLLKLYPSLGEPCTLPIDRQLMPYIQMERNLGEAVKFWCAQHEAGHAALSYALRFYPVRSIDILIGAIPYGNLHKQIADQEPLSLRIRGGGTSLEVSAHDLNDKMRHSIEALKHACQCLGGIAGNQGDERGADGDLPAVGAFLAGIPELTSSSKEDFDQTVTRLEAELQILASDIVADPVVAPRHTELAETLFENEYLDRTKIENILVPTTLPDYSRRIEEIGERFNIPLAR